ncbi:hypothetical protein NDU88_000295 [Pleurodeles waltl]|uniref:Uncharacterized protein n=1 Tax=Pleurodeles waltl TaxID=8319 RepID=A0AAV7P0F8_PLEWA|nr:hypothetical protein NDU88_000295 [Pleurodeles waltl]
MEQRDLCLLLPPTVPGGRLDPNRRSAAQFRRRRRPGGGFIRPGRMAEGWQPPTRTETAGGVHPLAPERSDAAALDLLHRSIRAILQSARHRLTTIQLWESLEAEQAHPHT